MKFIDVSSHLQLEIDKGCKRLEILILSPFFNWHNMHSTTNFYTSPLIHTQKIFLYSMIKSLEDPKCPPNREVYNYVDSLYLGVGFLQKYNLSLYYKTFPFYANLFDTFECC